MTSQNNSAANSDDIQRVYADRDATKGNRYAFYQPDNRLQMASIERHLSRFLLRAFRGDLKDRRFLDVGCGNGRFLRRFAEWGADPANLTGTELLPDRLETAKRVSPETMTWHLGGLETLPAEETFDLVSACTVFTSVLDASVQDSLAAQMWDRTAPGGWVLVFDFRFNNPNNKNVRRIDQKDARRWWPQRRNEFFQTMILAPPLSRRIAPISPFLASALELIPMLRTHFIYAAQK